MYYYNKRSSEKIIHTKKCFHIVNADIDNIGTFETLYEAYAAGYRTCKHCETLKKAYRKEEKEIINYCVANGLSAHLGDKCINVTSPRSKWKILVDESGRILLYHKNKFEQKDTPCEISGYHPQLDVLKPSITEYLEYILDHDKFRIYFPLSKAQHGVCAPVKKGTRRYRAELKKNKKRERRLAIRNVFDIFNSIG